MVAVRKKKGPAVGLILRSPDALRDRRRPRSIGINTLDRTLGVRGIDDYTLASPTAAARSQSAGKHLWGATGDRHFLQLPVGEKCHVGSIRRPEGVTCALRPGQKRNAG